MPDEIFHMSVDSIFRLMSKQVGMGAVGYDFRTEEQKKIAEFMTGDATQGSVAEASGAF